MVADYDVSERRACKLLAIDRSSYRYEPQPDEDAQLRQDLIELARQKPRFGYRRLGALLVTVAPGKGAILAGEEGPATGLRNGQPQTKMGGCGLAALSGGVILRLLCLVGPVGLPFQL